MQLLNPFYVVWKRGRRRRKGGLENCAPLWLVSGRSGCCRVTTSGTVTGDDEGRDGEDGRCFGGAVQKEKQGGGPPDGPLMLGGLQQASVVGHDLVLGQVQVELQRNQHGELEGDQLPPVHSEALLQFLRGGGRKEERQKQIQALFLLL